MPDEHSFDVVSRVDLAEVKNAVGNAAREVATRYDLKGLPIRIEWAEKERRIEITAPDEHKIEAVWDLLKTHLVRRKVPMRNVVPGRVEEALGGAAKRTAEIRVGIPPETAKEIARAVKESGLKVRAEIRADEVRVVGRKRDDLQAAIAALRAADFRIDLQFTNYR
jgi:uncharacterized protein YajQ (UPF0234 family)